MNRIRTIEQFVEKSNEIHDNRYDYSKFKYINSTEKSIIICPIHGEFLKNQNKHISGQGCPKCRNKRKTKKHVFSAEDIERNKINFIKNANDKYNFKYNYSEFDYVGYDIPSKIICPIHGLFFKSLHYHITSKYGCPKCGNDGREFLKFKYDQNSFIEKSNIIHNYKYDYSQSIYNGTTKEIEIICPSHGKFKLKRSIEHICVKSRGCPKCGVKSRGKIYKLSQEDLLKKLNHNKYDYSLMEYVNMKEKVKIVCKIHNLAFEQSLDSHISKNSGCPICAKESNNKKKIGKTKVIFIKRRKEIHGNKYDYSKFLYNGVDISGIIICPYHGEFLQDPYHHTNRRQGCPNCSESIGEREVSSTLIKYGLKFITQKRFKNCKDKNPLPFDFYLTEFNMCIEYDGEQHYIAPSSMCGKVFTKEESIKIFEYTKKHDRMKDEYCHSNDIKLLRISYLDFNNIEAILRGYFNNNFDMSFNS